MNLKPLPEALFILETIDSPDSELVYEKILKVHDGIKKEYTYEVTVYRVVSLPGDKFRLDKTQRFNYVQPY